MVLCAAAISLGITLDMQLDLPMSLFGAAYGAALLVYYRILNVIRPFHLTLLGGFAVLCLLPVWGGAHDKVSLVMIPMGLVTIAVGLLDHLNLDRLVHEPGRLAILTVLSSIKSADFTFLQQATGLTKGTLSSHLTKLEEAGLLTIDKRFVLKKSHTTASLTQSGRRRIEAHWRQLELLRKQFDPGR